LFEEAIREADDKLHETSFKTLSPIILWGIRESQVEYTMFFCEQRKLIANTGPGEATAFVEKQHQ